MIQPAHATPSSWKTSVAVAITLAAVLSIILTRHVAEADGACPAPFGCSGCGLGVKGFENDLCGAGGSTGYGLPVPETLHTIEGETTPLLWQREPSVGLSDGRVWDNYVVGTYLTLEAKQYNTDAIGVPSPDGEDWANGGFEIFVLRQKLHGGMQNAAGFYAFRPTERTSDVSGNQFDHTRIAWFVYVHGSGHARIRSSSNWIRADSQIHRDTLAMALRMVDTTTCAYAYNSIDCRNNSSYWRFAWWYDPPFDQHNTPWPNALTVKVSRDALRPVLEAYHGLEMKGAPAETDSRIDLHTYNHMKYYFSTCNCLEHCNWVTGGCTDCRGAYWQESREGNPPNVVPWGDLSASIEENGFDVYDPAKSYLRGHLNDPGHAVYDICKGVVGDTPCSCEPLKLSWTTPRCQAGDTWCWAAAVQSVILNLTGSYVDQCELVREAHAIDASVTCGEIAGQLRPGYPWLVSQELELHGVDVGDFSVGPMSMVDIKHEIDNGRPIFVTVFYGDRNIRDIVSGAATWHAVLVTGYECGVDRVYYYNIQPCGDGVSDSPGAWIDYDEMVSNAGFRWEFTQTVE